MSLPPGGTATSRRARDPATKFGLKVTRRYLLNSSRD